MHQPIHSDFIIHWTGKDIYNLSNSNKREKDNLYLERLRDILKYGLWMTKNKEETLVIIDGEKIKRPNVARTCFTELRLSKVQTHAKEFGCLGIGFKRFFLFDRLGSPMIYYLSSRRNWFFPPFISNQNKNDIDLYFLCFLKLMAKRTKNGYLQYKYFDESEWRIIYSEDIRKLILANSELFFKNCSVDIETLFKNPRNNYNRELNNYYKKLKEDKKPSYLIPLDAWFSMIIYPNISVKNRAKEDKEIKELIKTIKAKNTPGCPSYERENHPIEVNLSACRNF